MSDGAFESVLPFARLRSGAGIPVRVRDVDIALFLIEGKVFAVENLCPHQHIPVLAEGELDGRILTCPMHGWSFDITTGRCTHASCRLRHFETRVEGGEVFIAVPEDERSWW
ncbi:MAG: Rieske (2Fe-2S) protein [Bacteroidetes bacterium]|nr:Rieske (2Fe-2S) protein [Bacteroidota bacterium]